MSPLAPASPVHFIMPAQSLLRYVSTYYFARIETTDDQEQEDLLHPEWSSARFTLLGSTRGNIVTEAPVAIPPAIITGPTEKFVYVIRPDSTVAAQKVSVEHIDDGQAAVSGLKAGERIVLEGAQNLRPGAKVRETQSGQSQPRTPADA